MALDGFAELGTNIHLYDPPDALPEQLVILCTWMGAADKHIARYVDLYKRNVPTARILLLESVVSSMIIPYTK